MEYILSHSSLFFRSCVSSVSIIRSICGATSISNGIYHFEFSPIFAREELLVSGDCKAEWALDHISEEKIFKTSFTFQIFLADKIFRRTLSLSKNTAIQLIHKMRIGTRLNSIYQIQLALINTQSFIWIIETNQNKIFMIMGLSLHCCSIWGLTDLLHNQKQQTKQKRPSDPEILKGFIT